MQAKDIYATGTGSSPVNSKLIEESKKKKAAEIEAKKTADKTSVAAAGKNNYNAVTGSPPKAESSFKTLMRKLEDSYSSPEIQEILGNANPSKSPEEVGTENWLGQKTADVNTDSLYRVRPALQYEINKKWDLSAVMDEGGHINGQKRDGIVDMPYGSSTIGHAGCEIIAVYNLLQDMGRDVSFPEVIRTADEIDCLVSNGNGGILPGGTKRLLQAYGIEFEEVSKNTLQAWADHGYMFDGEQYIAITWNTWSENKILDSNLKDGIHTFLMLYDADGREKIISEKTVTGSCTIETIMQQKQNHIRI